jgi:hypothetical protein
MFDLVDATPPAPDFRPRRRSWSWLYQAAAIVEHLDQCVGMPIGAPPKRLLVWLESRIEPARLARIKRELGATFSMLDALLELPEGTFDAAPTVEVAAQIVEHAAASGSDLRIRYWSAGRREITVRRVTPIRLSRRGSVATLDAYCHLRNAERSFRLDRLQSVEPLPPEPGSAPIR